MELQMLRVPVSHLEPNPWNPNKMDDRTFQAERESIRTYGFIDPIIVRPHPTKEGRWQIIDGEHRWRAAQEEEIEEVPITPLNLSDAAAMKLTVIANETRGNPDVADLGKLLARIQAETDEEDFRMGLPYSDAELQHLTALGEVDWDRFDPEGEGPPGDDDETPKIEVTLAFTDDQHKRYHTFLSICRKEFEADNDETALLAALEIVAKQVNQ